MRYISSIFPKSTGDLKQFRLFLFLLFVFSILAVSITFFAVSIGKPYIGTVLSLNDEGWTVESIDPYGLESEAGIREGDRPVEINGQPAETFLEKYRRNGVIFGMLVREMTVTDEHGQLKSVTLKDSAPSWQFLVGQIERAVVVLIFWIAGFFVLLKKPREVATLLLCFSGLTFGLALSSNMATSRAIPTAAEFQVVAYTIAPWLLLHFFLVLPDERIWQRKSRLVYLVYLLPTITLVLLPFVGWVEGQPVQWFRTVRLFEVGVGFMAVAGVAIFNYIHTVSLRTRQQMKIVLVGCLIALTPPLLLYLLPEAIWRKSILPPGSGVLFIAFIPLAMGYAVVTQKLMDIDVIIRRGIVYGLVTAVMAAILSVAIFSVLAFPRLVGIPEEIIIALLLGGIATALFGPTKKGIEILVDRFLYKDRYDYRQIIQSLSTALNSINDLTDVSRLVVGTTVNTLNLTGGCLFIKTQSGHWEVGADQGAYAETGKQGQLLALLSKRNQMTDFPYSASTISSELAFLIPLSAGEREVGILCLSPKISKQDFSSGDMYLLQGIALVAAMALHSSMLVRDVSIRDTFVSVASHELRTPLTSIVGYADLLMRRNPPNGTRERWLKNILNNGQRVSAIVDDLLNVSHIQSGKFNIKLDRVKLPDVLEETLSFTKETTKKHEFVIDMASDLPDVLMDRDKFNQVVGNLLSNAIKYSPNGGRITLLAHSDQERHRIVVSIADEGIGIDPVDKDLLFTAFHRIQRPETQGIKGSGVGLYIAKEWTKAMGGEIWCESELNKGSTFFVAIPIQDSGGTS